MRYVSEPIYCFRELSDQARERAKHDFASIHGFLDADEALNSLEALAKHFGGRLVDYSIDFFGESYSHATFETPMIDESDIDDLVASLGDGSGLCVLTGVSFDEDAIDGVRHAFASGERDAQALLQAGFSTWLRAVQSECLAQYDDENFGEMADENGMEFRGDGCIFRPSRQKVMTELKAAIAEEIVSSLPEYQKAAWS